jgi:hypothetical protein
LPTTTVYAIVSNGKRKMEAQAIFLNPFSVIHFPFSHSANESLSFVRLFAKKQTEVTRLQNGPNGLAHLCQYVKDLQNPKHPHITSKYVINISAYGGEVLLFCMTKPVLSRLLYHDAMFTSLYRRSGIIFRHCDSDLLSIERPRTAQGCKHILIFTVHTLCTLEDRR